MSSGLHGDICLSRSNEKTAMLRWKVCLWELLQLKRERRDSSIGIDLELVIAGLLQSQAWWGERNSDKTASWLTTAYIMGFLCGRRASKTSLMSSLIARRGKTFERKLNTEPLTMVVTMARRS